MPIEHISDTARWVAYYRAMETERPDAIFRDPFAKRLAGEQGREIVHTMKRGRQAAWAMITRTAVFDEIILKTIAEHNVDVVMNLAAGLDARPWRLPLPASLTWVDVDLPGILDYKLEVLKGETPKCRYEAERVDLTDGDARRALFRRVGGIAQRALVVTEGLLVYLLPEQVAELAKDLHAQPSFRWWVVDIVHPRLMKMMNRSWGKDLGRSPFKFAPAESTEFFRPLGWREVAFNSSMDAARRLKREMSMMWLWRAIGRLYPKRRREEFARFSGFPLLERL
jgi:methyltransferase (TIGR00027 family)